MGMSEVQTLLARRIQQTGAAATARELGVSRASLTGYLAGVSRQATRLLVEARTAERLGQPPGGGGK